MLCVFLEHEEDFVRAGAIVALGVVTEKGRQRLDHPSSDVRFAALQALAQVSTTRTLQLAALVFNEEEMEFVVVSFLGELSVGNDGGSRDATAFGDVAEFARRDQGLYDTALVSSMPSEVTPLIQEDDQKYPIAVSSVVGSATSGTTFCSVTRSSSTEISNYLCQRRGDPHCALPVSD